jgi:hypothetical protein
MIKRIFLWIIAVVIIISALNIKVTTKQGVDYKVSTLRIPLYLKVLDFFDRHYNYKLLVDRITDGSAGEESRIMKIFDWTYANIRKTPAGYPVIDDHVWHIIVRGYGSDDQSADVFTTLCNYAGTDAFFNWVGGNNGIGGISLSFVKVEGRWVVFDSYRGVYFKNTSNEFASVEDIMMGDWSAAGIDSSVSPDFDYTDSLKGLQAVKDVGFTRANTQSPLNRLVYEVRKLMRTK